MRVRAVLGRRRVRLLEQSSIYVAAQDFDLGGGFQHYSGSYPMVFQHSGAQDFDLGGGFHYSGSYPMVFQHSDVLSVYVRVQSIP